MFSFICGAVMSINDNTVVLKNNGIGFELQVSNATLVNISEGKTVQLFVYLQTRDDGMSLFGFSSENEKTMFLRLISVGGVGPKVALSVLSGLKLSDLALAILNNDCATLMRVKGIGKKTAERIILELKEKISPFEAVGAKIGAKQQPMPTEGEEAIGVLMTLGLSKADATERVLKAVKEGFVSAQEILSKALKG